MRFRSAMRCDNVLRIAIDRDHAMATKDTAKLSSKFQISIPKAIRTARRWQAGQVFAFIPKGEGMLLVPVLREELAGLARGAKPKNYRDRTSASDAACRPRHGERERNRGDARFPMTGHSLGGGLAQIMGVWEEVPFVTFNAPAMKNAKAANINIFKPMMMIRTLKAQSADDTAGVDFKSVAWASTGSCATTW